MPRAIEGERRRLLWVLSAAFCRVESVLHTVPSRLHNVSLENAASVLVPGLRRPFELRVLDWHKEMKFSPLVFPHHPVGTAVQSCFHRLVRDANPHRRFRRGGHMQTN